MGFSRQEYWSGLPFPPQADLLDPGIKPGSPALQADSLPSDREDPLEKEMATHASILAWRILWTEECVCVCVCVSRSVVSDSLRPHEL